MHNKTEAETEGAENWTIFGGYLMMSHVENTAILHLTSTQQDGAFMKPGVYENH